MKRSWVVHSAMALAAAVVLSACGGPSGEPEATSVPQVAAAPARGGDLTAAVPLGTPAAAAKLQFRPVSRPVVGQPLEVELRLTATQAVEGLEVVLDPEGGLSLHPEATRTFAFGATAQDEEHSHEARLLPTGEGVHLLKARVVTHSQGQPSATEFAMPLLVLSADDPAVAGPAAAPGTAEAGAVASPPHAQ